MTLVNPSTALMSDARFPYKIPQRRWACPHCKATGWETPGQTLNPRKDHARPDGRDCVKARA